MQPEWHQHYTRNKSGLTYPDENLVRLLAKNIKNAKGDDAQTAVDIGCGSGRHLKLLYDFNIPNIIGTDISLNALTLAAALPAVKQKLILSDNKKLPIKDLSIDIAVAWGSLHYGTKDELPIMVKEIFRILKTGGRFMGTLRSSRDTMLKKGRCLGNDVWQTSLADIAGATVSFFDKEELPDIFSRFKQFDFGLAERSMLGDTASIVSHWIFLAVK